ncbi:MAG TPA: CPBP family intramembrane glutamic endopeptidase [Chloroflexia bacterium]|nr:CPBP family intramembrane glutamic endopeptidase [Chloroflexia bacterium]
MPCCPLAPGARLTGSGGDCYNAPAMSTVLFLLGSAALLVVLAWVTYQSGRLLRSVPVRENLLLAPVENAVKAGIIALCAGLAVLSGLPPAQFGWTLDHPSQDIAVGILAGLGTQVAVNLVTHWAIRRYGKGVYSPVVMINIFPRTRGEWLLVPAAMGLAVLLEEVLFRSLLLGGWSAWLPAPLLLLVLGAVFGLMHSPQGTLGMVISSFVGMGLGGLFLWSGSLLTPFVAHYLINLLQLLRAREEWRWLQEY